MNFYEISVIPNAKTGVTDIKPDFLVEDNDPDLMIRGKSFYAVWNEETGLWSTNEYTVKTIVDKELMQKMYDLKATGYSSPIQVKKMRSFSSHSWEEYKSYISKMPDRWTQLDEKLTFADTKVDKHSFVSKRLNYALKPGSHESFDEILETLYSKEDAQKIIWAIGSVVSGDSRDIQKFIVLYGKGGTGKSTIIKIFNKLFKDYCATFDA